MYTTALEDDLDPLTGRRGGGDGGVMYLERVVMAIYAVGPLGIMVAYFILRVEVSLDRVVMTLVSNISFEKTAADSVATGAFELK